MRLMNSIALFVWYTFRFHKFYHARICLSVYKFIGNLCPILSTVNERSAAEQKKQSSENKQFLYVYN